MNAFFTAVVISLFMLMGSALVILVWDGLDRSLKQSRNIIKEEIYSKIESGLKKKLRTIVLLKKR